MRNPILQETAPGMCSSDLRMLLRSAKAREGKLLDETELLEDTIKILETELGKRK